MCDATDSSTGKAAGALPLLDVAIVTVARQTSYIDGLLDCLGSEYKLRLTVGGPDIAYLSAYQEKPHIEILGFSSHEWARFQSAPVHHRATWNYWRALAIGGGPPGAKGLVIFEDDVHPANGWRHRLIQIITSIERAEGERFVLAGYTAYGVDRLPALYYASYPVQAFFGTQMMHIPTSCGERVLGVSEKPRR